MKVLLLLFLAALTSATGSYRIYNIEDAPVLFGDFINTFHKHYANEAEKAKRFEIFKKNLQFINQRNLESNSAVYGITKFSDLTKEEFLNLHTGGRDMDRDGPACQSKTANSTSAPDSFSWKDQNVISKVRDQEMCGSCWAFGAIGNVEAHYAIKHKDVLDLSEQQLVDCDKNSYGCEGSADLQYAFVYLKDSGSMLEKDYSYKAEDGECKYDASKVKVKVTDCFAYKHKTEDVLKNIVYSTGPVTVGVDASGFQFYTGGVLPSCEFDNMNHAVLFVGYGSENGTPFWLIKNSWGESWGEDGFIRIKRGENACGLLTGISVQAVVE